MIPMENRYVSVMPVYIFFLYHAFLLLCWQEIPIVMAHPALSLFTRGLVLEDEENRLVWFFKKTLTLWFSVILTPDMYVRHNDQTSAKNNYWLDICTVQRLSLKHRFGGCGHGFSECDGLGELSGFSRLGESGEFNGFSGFDGFRRFGGLVF